VRLTLHRIELCANLVEGGTTPSAGTLATCRLRLRIPIFVLVRPRGGDFLYSAAELGVMLEDIRRVKDAGAHGVVVGVLRADGTIDAERTRQLIAAARPLAVTFHRAFDVSRDAGEALETLIGLGVERVLTSGQAAAAPQGADAIARLVRRAAGRIGVLPGGGITADNVEALVRSTGVAEVHLTGAVTRRSDMAFFSDWRRDDYELCPNKHCGIRLVWGTGRNSRYRCWKRHLESVRTTW